MILEDVAGYEGVVAVNLTRHRFSVQFVLFIYLWAHLLHSFAVVHMIHRKCILSLISGADRHLCVRGRAPQWNTSQNVAIQERFLSSTDYALQQNARTYRNAGRHVICTNVAPNAISYPNGPIPAVLVGKTN